MTTKLILQDPKTEFASFRMTKETKRKLKKLRKERKITISKIVEWAVDNV